MLIKIFFKFVRLFFEQSLYWLIFFWHYYCEKSMFLRHLMQLMFSWISQNWQIFHIIPELHFLLTNKQINKQINFDPKNENLFSWALRIVSSRTIVSLRAPIQFYWSKDGWEKKNRGDEIVRAISQFDSPRELSRPFPNFFLSFFNFCFCFALYSWCIHSNTPSEGTKRSLPVARSYRIKYIPTGATSMHRPLYRVTD